jgi:hypothetical protein
MIKGKQQQQQQKKKSWVALFWWVAVVALLPLSYVRCVARRRRYHQAVDESVVGAHPAVCSIVDSKWYSSSLFFCFLCHCLLPIVSLYEAI